MRFLFRSIALNEKHLRFVLMSIAAVLGVFHAWAGRFAMNPDGMSYLDIADAYFAGQWQMALNAFWSPLYSWLLGFGLFLLRPSPAWESASVHAINFFIYCFALFSFDFFLRSLSRSLPEERVFPRLLWFSFGYAIFLIVTLHFISLALVTPDMLVAAWVFLAAGIMARVQQGERAPRLFFWLGVSLGMGYLTKSAMFPIAFIMLGATGLAIGTIRKALPLLLISLTVFLFISSPFITFISLAKGRVTIGEAGRLNYVWHVNNVARYLHWQGNSPEFGSPLHATRKIFNNPAIFEFGEPLGGTYPPWYDPSFWYEGIKPRFDAKAHLPAFLVNMRALYDMMAAHHIITLGFGFLMLFLMASPREQLRNLWFMKTLLLSSAGAIAMFLALVVRARYIAPFMGVGVLAAFASVRLPDVPESRRVIASVIGVLFFVMVVTIAVFSFKRISQSQSNINWEIASVLTQKNVITSGDRVAVVGHYFSGSSAYWARLARVKIVAEHPSNVDTVLNNFWKVDESTRRAALEAFKKTGAKIIVAEDAPLFAVNEGWERIGESSSLVLNIGKEKF